MEIKTMSVPRLVRAVHSIGIELTGSNPFNPDVPHITGAVAGRIEINHSGGRCVLRKIKKLQTNSAGVTAQEGEVDSPPIFMGSQG